MSQGFWFCSDISFVNDWLLYKVTAVVDRHFSKAPPCRRMLKTSSHHKDLTDHRAKWAYHQQRKAFMPQRSIWCPSEYCGVLTLWREDAHSILLPSVTSVCVLGCLEASPTPPAPSAHNSELPCESLASSPIYTAVEWSDCERLALPLLIGQG